jgi:hypothetical protein
MDAAFGTIAVQPTQAQRVAAAKEARLDAQEQYRAEVAANAAYQETLRRFIERKETQIDALP